MKKFIAINTDVFFLNLYDKTCLRCKYKCIEQKNTMIALKVKY